MESYERVTKPAPSINTDLSAALSVSNAGHRCQFCSQDKTHCCAILDVAIINWRGLLRAQLVAIEVIVESLYQTELKHQILHYSDVGARGRVTPRAKAQ